MKIKILIGLYTKLQHGMKQNRRIWRQDGRRVAAEME
jgi:hypothetical protein